MFALCYKYGISLCLCRFCSDKSFHQKIVYNRNSTDDIRSIMFKEGKRWDAKWVCYVMCQLLFPPLTEEDWHSDVTGEEDGICC
jgi:hypothetical protein